MGHAFVPAGVAAVHGEYSSKLGDWPRDYGKLNDGSGYSATVGEMIESLRSGEENRELGDTHISPDAEARLQEITRKIGTGPQNR